MVAMPTTFNVYMLCEVRALGKGTHFIIGTVFTIKKVGSEDSVQQ